MTRDVYLLVRADGSGALSHTPLVPEQDTALLFHYTFKTDLTGAQAMHFASRESGTGPQMHYLHTWVQFEYATVDRIK